MFGKSWKTRLTECYTYIAGLHLSEEKLENLRNAVNRHTSYTPEEISKAISLPSIPPNSTKQLRTAIRSLLLVKIALDGTSIAQAAVLRGSFTAWAESRLDAEIKTIMLRQALGILSKPPSGNVDSIAPVSYGISLATVKQKGQSLTAPLSTTAPVMRPDIDQDLTSVQTQTFGTKLQAFDLISRLNIVLSGHGSWKQFDPVPALGPHVTQNDGWLFVKLKPLQEIRFYINHYYPLGNDVGKRIDHNENVVPVEVIAGDSKVFNYTLHPKHSLHLGNHSAYDRTFVTVQSDTLLSHFINQEGYESAVFHWAACRVVFDKTNAPWDPVANRWKTWNGTRWV
jgi:hypothetical protein